MCLLQLEIEGVGLNAGARQAATERTSIGMSAEPCPIYYVDSFSFTHLNLLLLNYVEISGSLNSGAISGHKLRAGGRGCVGNVGLGGDTPDLRSMSRVVGE